MAYTGTPIDKTERTFGDYIDKYTMRQSIADKTTLEIVYEGRTHNAEVADRAGMDRKRQMPIFRIMRAELWDNRDLNEDEIAQNVDLTLNTFNLIEREVRAAGFWDSTPAQNRLKGELQQLLLSARFASLPNVFSKRQVLVSRLMEWARANRETLARS